MHPAIGSSTHRTGNGDNHVFSQDAITRAIARESTLEFTNDMNEPSSGVEEGYADYEALFERWMNADSFSSNDDATLRALFREVESGLVEDESAVSS